MFVIDKIKRMWRHQYEEESSILKTCPKCFTCFYGIPDVELEKCNNCKENINGQN